MKVYIGFHLICPIFVQHINILCFIEYKIDALMLLGKSFP